MIWTPTEFHGCLANPYYTPDSLRQLAASATGKFSEVRKWEEYLTLIEDQGTTSTCEAVSATNLVEPLMRKHIDRNLFAGNLGLDWAAIHRGAWMMATGKPEELYSDKLGLPLGASLAWMREVGILPPLARIVEVGDTPNDMAEALDASPVQVGVVVHDGFDPARVAGLGEITEPTQIPPDSGHAMTVFSLIGGRDGAIMDSMLQSWGTEYGYKGFVQCRHQTLVWSFIDRPRGVALSPEDIRDWIAGRKHWEEFIIRRAGA